VIAYALSRVEFQVRRLSAAAFLVALGLAGLTAPARADDFTWDAKAEKELAKREKKVDKVQRLGATWFHLETETFEIHADVDARFTAECSLFMDTFRERFAKTFQGESRVDRKASVFVFGSQEKYKAEVKSSGRGLYKYHFDAQGKFTEHALYTYVEGTKDSSFTKFYTPILLHEGTHMLIRERVGARLSVPRWFDEGLATYMQLWDLTKSAAQNLQDRPKKVVNAEYFKTSFEKNTFPELEALLAIQAKEWASDDFGPITKGQYAAVESLFVYLMSDANERKKVSRMYEAVVAGNDPADILDAKERKKLSSSWRDFARNLGGVK